MNQNNLCPKCGKPIWGEGWDPENKVHYFSHCNSEDAGRCEFTIEIPEATPKPADGQDGEVVLPMFDEQYVKEFCDSLRPMWEMKCDCRERQLLTALREIKRLQSKEESPEQAWIEAAMVAQEALNSIKASLYAMPAPQYSMMHHAIRRIQELWEPELERRRAAGLYRNYTPPEGTNGK